MRFLLSPIHAPETAMAGSNSDVLIMVLGSMWFFESLLDNDKREVIPKICCLKKALSASVRQYDFKFICLGGVPIPPDKDHSTDDDELEVNRKCHPARAMLLDSFFETLHISVVRGPHQNDKRPSILNELFDCFHLGTMFCTCTS